MQRFKLNRSEEKNATFYFSYQFRMIHELISHSQCYCYFAQQQQIRVLNSQS